MISLTLLGPGCGPGDDPQVVETLQNHYADIMRDSMEIINSREVFFCAQAWGESLFIMQGLHETLRPTTPRSRQYPLREIYALYVKLSHLYENTWALGLDPGAHWLPHPPPSHPAAALSPGHSFHVNG